MDVVIVPFPFTDRHATKRRPALVISGKAFNRQHDQTVLAMITTAEHSKWPSDVLLANWNAAGLSLACIVRFKIFTLDSSLILRAVGHLAQDDQRAVRKSLKALFGETPR